MVSVKKQGRFEVFSLGVEEPWSVYRDNAPFKQVWTWPEVEKILGSGEAVLSNQKAALKQAEERKKLCAYCDKPTRKGSMLLDEGQTAHRSCYKEFERS